MRSEILRVLSSIFLLVLLVLVTPTKALAVPIQSLNGQTGQTQTFQNDLNLVINSLNNVHSLAWQGLLPVSRGGTGASSFQTGSLLFSNGTTILEDNLNLNWDDTNNWLGIGARLSLRPPTLPEQVSEALIEAVTPEGAFNGIGSPLALIAGHGEAGGHGGDLTLSAGGNFETGNGGDAFLLGGNAAGNGGNVLIQGGIPESGKGGDVILSTVSGSGGDGRIILAHIGSGQAILDVNSLSSPDKTYSFPNLSGTFSLLEADQTFTGLNKFESSTSSTIYVGSASNTGCIALGDDDGNGVTYVTVNDGLLTASISKPSTCQ